MSSVTSLLVMARPVVSPVLLPTMSVDLCQIIITILTHYVPPCVTLYRCQWFVFMKRKWNKTGFSYLFTSLPIFRHPSLLAFVHGNCPSSVKNTRLCDIAFFCVYILMLLVSFVTVLRLLWIHFCTQLHSLSFATLQHIVHYLLPAF